jgi:hypothetical protein
MIISLDALRLRYNLSDRLEVLERAEAEGLSLCADDLNGFQDWSDITPRHADELTEERGEAAVYAVEPD